MTKPVRGNDLLSAVLRVAGKGTRVEPRATPAGEAGSAVRALHVLLAEDNAVSQRLAARLLEKGGHRVTLAGDGRAAFAAFEASVFDIVLTDVQMPEMDGFALAAAIRERERTGGGHTPIVALTAHAMKGDEERCLAAGMDGYLAKPVQPRALHALLDRIHGADHS